MIQKTIISVLVFAFSLSPIYGNAKLIEINQTQEQIDNSRALIKKWKQARKLAVKKRHKQAIILLKRLFKKGFRDDEVALTLARVYFERKQFSKALEYYNNVSKSSEFWLEAIEEKGWTYLRMGEYGKSYAETLTLLSPVFDQYVNSETYYLASVNRYFVCDYTGVFKVTHQLKNRYAKRVEALQEVVSAKSNSSIDEIIKISTQAPITYKQAAPFTIQLPEYFYKDVRLQRLLQTNNKSSHKIYKRFQQLAKNDLRKIRKNIDKLSVVEAEVIQRVYEQNNKPIDPLSQAKLANGIDTLSFPVSNDEVWIDELNSFNVKASQCPGRKTKEASL